MSTTSYPGMPESNVDNIAANLVIQTCDLDGDGLVYLMRFMVTQAEKVRDIRRRGAGFGDTLSTGKIPEQHEINGVLIDSLQEHIHQWFISRVMKSLAEHLEYDFNQKQKFLRPIQRINFTEQGEVIDLLLSDQSYPA